MLESVNVTFLNTTCALCGTSENSKVIFEARLDELSTTSKVFSARRLPDRRFYRWVRCNSCSLYRSDPVLNINLADLYKDSTFDYGNEISGLQATYAKIVKESIKPDTPCGHLLEIGGGNGFFLEKALEMGFDSITGVEPSKSAVDSALPNIRTKIIMGMFNDESVEDCSAKVIAIFHTLDHLENPVKMLQIAKSKLQCDGRVVVAVHNVHSFSARILKSRSPIFDVEHTFLFSKKTLRLALENAGFYDVQVKSYLNLYSLLYILHLLPIPRQLKVFLINSKIICEVLSRIKVWLPLGNIYAHGSKSNHAG